MSNIGLRGRTVVAVREWQADSSNKDRTATLMLDDLESAEVYDVDAIVPALKDVRSHLPGTWEKMPEQWKGLVTK